MQNKLNQFLIHKLNIPNNPQIFSALKAAELLSRGMQLVPTHPFEWSVIDKPVGRIYTILKVFKRPKYKKDQCFYFELILAKLISQRMDMDGWMMNSTNDTR